MFYRAAGGGLWMSRGTLYESCFQMTTDICMCQRECLVEQMLRSLSEMVEATTHLCLILRVEGTAESWTSGVRQTDVNVSL